MKKSILIVLISILLTYPISLMGAEYETPHEFKAGDTISAEMMNEIFEYIKNSKTRTSYNDLVGTWSCEKFTFCADPIGGGNCYLRTIDDYTQINNWFVRYGIITTFTKNDDGSMTWNSSNYNVFNINGHNDSDHCDGSGSVSIINNTIGLKNDKYCSGEDDTTSRLYNITKYTNDLYNWIGIGTNNCDTSACLTCTRLNLAPNPPSSLTYALPADNSSSSITLTWTDSQTEAVTGYKVIRKTVVTDNFTTVSTITDNTTRTYADDNVTESGKYWYRVLAYNTNGDGTPSKVVKAEFPDDEAPTGTLKIDNATTTTTSSSVTLNLTATDNKGVVGYLASESSAPPSTDSTSWVSITSTTSYSADVSFTLSSGYGVKFVYVWFKDAKGNIAGYGASITYTSTTGNTTTSSQ